MTEIRSGIESAPICAGYRRHNLSGEYKKNVAPFSGKIGVDDLEADEAGYTMITGKGPLITLNANDRAARRRLLLAMR